jgi:Periplasmic protease
MTVIVRILFAVACAAALISNDYPQTRDPTPAKFTPAELREDLQVVRQALEEGHGGVYRYQSKVTLDNLFEQTRDSLNRPLTVLEFFRKLAPVVATIECGHTSLNVPEDIQKDLVIHAPLLPFQVKMIDGRAFVFRDLTAKESSTAGKELIAINDIPTAKILKTMFAATNADAGIQSAKQWRLSNGWRFNINLFSLLGITSPYDLELRNLANGKISKVQVSGINLPKLKKRWLTEYPQDQESLQEKDPTASLRFLQNNRIALLSIGSFSPLIDSQRRLGLKNFIQDSFISIKRRKSDALIIDLRNNGGGDDDLGAFLLSFLLDKPFKYYDDIVANNISFSFLKYATITDPLPSSFVERGVDKRFHATKHPTWGIQYPQRSAFSGKVYVLINGGSFSTTAEFLSQLQYHKRALFIGEESGGGYYGNTSGFLPILTLPNTKLTLRIPLMTYYLAVGNSYPPRKGVVPDTQQPPRSEITCTGKIGS